MFGLIVAIVLFLSVVSCPPATLGRTSIDGDGNWLLFDLVPPPTRTRVVKRPRQFAYRPIARRVRKNIKVSRSTFSGTSIRGHHTRTRVQYIMHSVRAYQSLRSWKYDVKPITFRHNDSRTRVLRARSDSRHIFRGHGIFVHVNLRPLSSSVRNRSAEGIRNDRCLRFKSPWIRSGRTPGRVLVRRSYRVSLRFSSSPIVARKPIGRAVIWHLKFLAKNNRIVF